MQRPEDLCVLIGVGPGLGKSLAKAFSKDYAVAMVARDKKRLQSYESEFPAAKAFGANVADEPLFRATLRSILAFCRPKVLIYNAAVVEKSNFAMDKIPPANS